MKWDENDAVNYDTVRARLNWLIALSVEICRNHITVSLRLTETSTFLHISTYNIEIAHCIECKTVFPLFITRSTQCAKTGFVSPFAFDTVSRLCIRTNAIEQKERRICSKLVLLHLF